MAGPDRDNVVEMYEITSDDLDVLLEGLAAAPLSDDQKESLERVATALRAQLVDLETK